MMTLKERMKWESTNSLIWTTMKYSKINGLMKAMSRMLQSWKPNTKFLLALPGLGVKLWHLFKTNNSVDLVGPLLPLQ